MIKVTDAHIDTVYDATQTMRLFSQFLSGGEIDDRMASEMSWLLGSLKRRLDPIINLLEDLQAQQTQDYVATTASARRAEGGAR